MSEHNASKVIAIRHTRAEGTLVHGSSKGDGVYQILHALHGHWRPFRSLGCLGLLNTRDRPAKTWRIEQAAQALREAGHEVTVEIDDTAPGRSFAEAEADRYDRAERRAEHHESAAGTASARSEAAWKAEHQILDMIPMGQPILVGHHSERRHRRDLDRAESLRRRASAEEDKAGYHAERAEAAEQHQARRENIPTTLRRIKTLEADERRLLRDLEGRLDYQQDEAGEWKLTVIKPGERHQARLESQLASVRDQLTYWREHVKTAEAAGVKIWSRADFAKGDFVRFLGSWYEVLRVSAKSVTIPAMINDGHIVRREGARCTWTDTVPYDKVTGRKSASEIAAIEAEADRREREQATA